MKRLALSWILGMFVLGLAVPVFAEPQNSDGRGGQMRRVLKDLNLSSGQQQQVRSIMEKYRGVEGGRQEMFKEIQNILTPEQKDKLRAKMANRRDNQG